MTDIQEQRERPSPTDEEIHRTVPRERGGREVKVGLFVILGLIAGISVLYVLTDPATFRGRYLLVANFTDAGGIRRGDPVQMRGVIVGRINGFEMSGDQVHIRMEIEGEWEIPSDSRTRLTGQGLFGGRTMEIIPGEARTYAQAWDTLVGSSGMGEGLMASAEALGAQASDVLTNLNAILDEPTVGSVRTTASEIKALVTELRAIAEGQRQQLVALTSSLNRSAEGIETATEGVAPDIARAAARADSAMSALNRTSATLDVAAVSLGVILARVEGGEGTLGRLSGDDSLYLSLNRAAEAIALLAQDLRENPDRYIRIRFF